MRRGGLHAVLCGVVLALGGCAPDSSVGTWQAAIVAGEPEPDRPEVVAIGYPRRSCEEPLSPFCTGTLIAPKVVLTAAHCFDEMKPAAVYEVSSQLEPAAGAEMRVAVAVSLHPDYDSVTGDADLALLRLATAMTATPATVALDPASELSVGEAVELIGFGQSSLLSADPLKRRSGARVAETGPRSFRIVPGPGMTCHGDSGGPALITVDEQSFLVGVTSSGDPGCLEYGVEVRPDAYWKGFVEPYLAALPTLAPEGSSPKACGFGQRGETGNVQAKSDGRPFANEGCASSARPVRSGLYMIALAIGLALRARRAQAHSAQGGRR